MTPPRVLIVDDEADLRKLLARMLELEDYRVITATNAEQALRALRQEKFEVVITDVRMPGMKGTELVSEVKKISPPTEVICLTAYGNIRDGVEAMRNGAYDYVEKSEYRKTILPLLARAVEKARLQWQEEEARKQGGKAAGFANVIGGSPAILRTIELARRVAPTEATVLLTGPTGSGKEVFARAIHAESRRSGRPFVAVNCAALGHEILESELFGHKAGAFTGASKDKPGLFEEADGGTIFLDEIGEMEADLQAKVLRVLEDGTFLKVGETRERRVDVRVICATNKELQRAVEAGQFRGDLYYRLAIFVIELPSLNERREDIPALFQHFLTRYAKKTGARIEGATPSFLEALQRHQWKGNIRELRNVVERAVILSNGSLLEVNTLPPDFGGRGEAASSPETDSLEEVERRHIRRALVTHQGNKAQAARELGIGLTTLYAKLKKYGL